MKHHLKQKHIYINKKSYNIITYPDDFDLKYIEQINLEMIDSEEDIKDKKIRINLFERLIKKYYNNK